MDMDTEENIEEFLTIIQQLSCSDLTVFHQVLTLDNEIEQHKCLRKLRCNIINYPNIYNAYTARVLVNKPIYYIENEIVSRFKKQFLIY